METHNKTLLYSLFTVHVLHPIAIILNYLPPVGIIKASSHIHTLFMFIHSKNIHVA